MTVWILWKEEWREQPDLVDIYQVQETAQREADRLNALELEKRIKSFHYSVEEREVL